jgi:hypothetical protein
LEKKRKNDESLIKQQGVLVWLFGIPISISNMIPVTGARIFIFVIPASNQIHQRIFKEMAPTCRVYGGLVSYSQVVGIAPAFSLSYSRGVYVQHGEGHGPNLSILPAKTLPGVIPAYLSQCIGQSKLYTY